MIYLVSHFLSADFCGWAMQPRLPMSFEVGQVVLDDWLLHHPHHARHTDPIAVFGHSTPHSTHSPLPCKHNSQLQIFDTSSTWRTMADALLWKYKALGRMNQSIASSQQSYALSLLISVSDRHPGSPHTTLMLTRLKVKPSSHRVPTQLAAIITSNHDLC